MFGLGLPEIIILAMLALGGVAVAIVVMRSGSDSTRPPRADD